MNIFKTFETYLKEPLSILRGNFIQIVGIQTGNIFENQSSLDVNISDKKAQITVINNEKLYNLLSLVTHKANVKAAQQEGKNNHDTAKS